MDVPRDRAGTFTPLLVPKNDRRLGGLSDVVISLYAGGMTVRDISHHLHRVYGTEISPDTISTITDAVLDEVKAWQQRPLEEVYPVVYVDALVVKVRDGAHVRNKSAYLAVGVNLEGVKQVLGIWVQNTEGAKFWLQVCTELRNRGVRDVLIACCDGLAAYRRRSRRSGPAPTAQELTDSAEKRTVDRACGVHADDTSLGARSFCQNLPVEIAEVEPSGDQRLARVLLSVQHAAYAVEAATIGDDRIPPLHETLDDLRNASLRWLGAFHGRQLVGAIAWAECNDEVDIDRLVVDPTLHRQGVGNTLVREVLILAGDRRTVVSTGRCNVPARALYERLGFAVVAETEVIPGLWIMQYAHDPTAVTAT